MRNNRAWSVPKMVAFAGLAIVALLVIAAFARAQQPKPVRYLSWGAEATHPGTVTLYYDDRPLGRINPATGEWVFFNDQAKTHDLRAYADKYNPAKGHKPAGDLPKKPSLAADKTDCKCGDGCECMDGRVDPACKCEKCKCAIVAERLDPGVLTGVIADPLGTPAGPRFRLAGPAGVSDVTSEVAYQTLAVNDGGGTVPDDGHLPAITVIGDKSVREPILRDIETAPELNWLRGKARIQGEDPGKWRAGQERGFEQPKPGNVVIYAQRADGKDIWWQHGYEGRAERLSGRLLDKIDGYDPNRSPNPRNPGPRGPPADVSPWWMLPVCLAMGLTVLIPIALAVYVFRRK